MDHHDIAIIGTGIAAATLVHRLRAQANITLFDKARGMGGRMASRYTDTHQFDHGAQFFTARTPSFQAFLAPWIATGDVAPWTPNITTLSQDQRPFKRPWFEPHYVAAPRMNGLCKALMADIPFHAGTEIAKVERRDGAGWLVTTDEQRFGPFDWIISTAPAPQAARIFASAANPPFERVTFEPCFALMAPLPDDVMLPFDAAVVRDDVISWVAMSDRRPGRDCSPSLVAHATAAWAQAHLEEEPKTLVPALAHAVAGVTGIDGEALTGASAHRWRFSRTRAPLAQPCWVDEGQRLAACGDWCLGSTVEDAYTSANELAKALQRT